MCVGGGGGGGGGGNSGAKFDSTAKFFISDVLLKILWMKVKKASSNV